MTTEIIKNPALDYLYINQIKAADLTRHAIENLPAETVPLAVRETDVFKLRRGLCLPSAGATSVNKVEGYRLIGDTDGVINVGDIFRTLLPFHGNVFPDQDGVLKPWYFCTQEGDMYHQAILAFAEAIGVNGITVAGFQDVTIFNSFVKEGGAVAVSLDNKFVTEVTLGNQPKLVRRSRNGIQLLIESCDGLGIRNFQNGRHVVSIIDTNNHKNTSTVTDSFRLPQMDFNPIFELYNDEISKYLKYTTGGESRGIVFGHESKEKLLKRFAKYARIINIPQEIVSSVRANLV